MENKTILKMTTQEIKDCFWRVPLIALIAAFLYTPCYVRIVMRYGVVEPGVIAEGIGIVASAVLLLATLVLGWFFFLRKQTRRQIFVSSSIVVIYGVLLWLIQIVLRATTGATGLIFMKLSMPFQWATLPTEISTYFLNTAGVDLPLGVLTYFVPWLFVLFGRKKPIEKEVEEVAANAEELGDAEVAEDIE